MRRRVAMEAGDAPAREAGSEVRGPEEEREMATSRIDRSTRANLARRLTRRDTLRYGAAAGIALPLLGSAARSTRAAEDYQIAYLTPGLDVPFWKYLSDGIKQ